MAGGFNFGPPAINFAPLGQLGDRYAHGLKQRHEADIAARREEALAGFGQNGDLAALGKTLLQAGDLEGGMSALRIAAANEGTPWQKQRAAAEDARAAEADAYRRRQEEENNRRYEENKTRADRPTRITEDGTDPDTGMPTKREGLLYPDGTVKWRAPGAPDTQSGGPGDPNLPAAGGTLAQLTPYGNRNAPVTATGQPEYGYDIPNGVDIKPPLPHGTVRLPGAPVEGPPIPPGIAPPTGRTAVAAPPALSPDVPAVGATPTQTSPPLVAAPVGQTAVAAQPVAGAIQRRATRDAPLEPDTAPFVRWPPLNVPGKEWVAAETKRLAALAGGGTEKLTESQSNARLYAGKMEGAEKEFRPNAEATYSVGQRVLDNLLPGRSSNFITSDAYQAGNAAKREWVAALLRKTSGAQISDKEFELYNDIYFPEVGQSAAVAAQKARARERALEGIKAGLPPSEIVRMERESSGTPLAPAAGTAGDLKSGASASPSGATLRFDRDGNPIK